MRQFWFQTARFLPFLATCGLVVGIVRADEEHESSTTKKHSVETRVENGVIKVKVDGGEEMVINLDDADEAEAGDKEGKHAKKIKVLRMKKIGSGGEAGDHTLNLKVDGKAIFVGEDGKAHVMELKPGQFSEGKVVEGKNLFTWTGAAGGDNEAHVVIAGGGKYMIGVHPEEVSDELRSQLSIKEGTGLVIADVVSDSAAEKAGIENHDILLRINDNDVKGVESLISEVQKSGEAKTPMTVVILRGGKEKTVEVTPQERKEGEMAMVLEGIGDEGAIKEHLSKHLAELKKLGDLGDVEVIVKAAVKEAKEAAAEAAAHAEAHAEAASEHAEKAEKQARIEALAAQIDALKAELKALKKSDD